MSTVARLSFKLSRRQLEQFERITTKAKESRRWFSVRPVGHSEVFQYMLDRCDPGESAKTETTSRAAAQIKTPRPVRPPAARGGQTKRPRQVTLTEAIRHAKKKRGGK